MTKKNKKMVELLLGAIKNQEVLDLAYSYGDVGDGEAILLAEVLKENPPLRELSLIGNDITNKGARKLLKALKNNTNLRLLYLSKNDISDRLIAKINEALEEKRVAGNPTAVLTQYDGTREEVLSTLNKNNEK